MNQWIWLHRCGKWLILLCLIQMWITIPFTSAQVRDSTLKITILSIPDLSFNELSETSLAQLPNIRKLTEQGAVGAMNIRTPTRSVASSYLSIGAGAPVIGGSQMEAYSWAEGQRLYEMYMGTMKKKIPPQIVVPEINKLIEDNSETTYQPQIGLLGDTLKQNGIITYVYGNRDILLQHNRDGLNLRRSAPLLLMDSMGAVSFGEIGKSTVVKKPDYFMPLKTNYAELLKMIEHHTRAASLSKTAEQVKPQDSSTFQTVSKNSSARSVTLAELGDLERLFILKDYYGSERFEQLKLQVLQEMDTFIGKLMSGLGKDEQLWVLSPTVNSDAYTSKMRLSPIFIYGSSVKAGFLVTGSTKQQGVVVYSDVAPTLLTSFGVTVTEQMQGQPITIKADKEAFSQLRKDLIEMQSVYQLRPPLLYSFVIFEVIVLLLSLIFVTWRKKKPSRLISGLLYSVLLGPFMMLMMGYLVGEGIRFLIVFFVLALFGLSWWLTIYRISTALGVISWITTVAIGLDIALGAPGMKRSVLGYDPMIGGRYYGIGNEYMGVWIGALILGAAVALQSLHGRKLRSSAPATPREQNRLASLVQRSDVHGLSERTRLAYRIAVAASFALAAVMLAAPGLGADAGGAITACIGCGFAALRMLPGNGLRHISFKPRRLLLAGAAFGLIALALLWLLNELLPTSAATHSHISRAMDLLQAGRLDQITNIITRKLAMNWHLINVSAWSKVLITSLLVMAVMIFRPRGLLREWQTRYPFYMHGFNAIAIATFVALAVNDSGIVAAATMIVFVAVPMLLLRIDSLEQQVDKTFNGNGEI